VEGDVGKLTPERGAIHRKTDAVEPFVHPNGILAHALADDIERDLVIAKGAAGDTREDGEGVIPRELVAREVETLAGAAVKEKSGVAGPMGTISIPFNGARWNPSLAVPGTADSVNPVALMVKTT